MFVYAIDGDDIGKKIEYLMFSDDLYGARELSRKVEGYLREISGLFCNLGAETIFLAGDSVLLTSDVMLDFSIEDLEFEGITFSVGVGRSASDSILALKRAKGLGKNRIEKIGI